MIVLTYLGNQTSMIIIYNTLQVDSNMKLGEWAGLCKLDKDGKARKVVKCSSCVVKDWGKESPALDIVKDYIKSQK